MRTFVFYLVCITVILACRVQPLPGKAASTKQHRLLEESLLCTMNVTVPVEQRRQKYPFSHAVEVRLVSFKPNTEDFSKEALPVVNDTVDYSRMYEVIQLSQTQIDSLTNIFYSYGYRGGYEKPRNRYFIGTISTCYRPRNAILFRNFNRHVFEYVEICFECDKFSKSSSEVDWGVECENKLLLIKDFFKANGVQYGIVKESSEE